jgi:hypothetical protein
MISCASGCRNDGVQAGLRKKRFWPGRGDSTDCTGAGAGAVAVVVTGITRCLRAGRLHVVGISTSTAAGAASDLSYHELITRIEQLPSVHPVSEHAQVRLSAALEKQFQHRVVQPFAPTVTVLAAVKQVR